MTTWNDFKEELEITEEEKHLIELNEDMITATMTLDDIRNLPPLSEADIRRISQAQSNPDEECPAQTEENLKSFKPARKTYRCHSSQLDAAEPV